MRGWRPVIGVAAVVAVLSSVSDKSAYARQSRPGTPDGALTVVSCSGTIDNAVREYALRRIEGSNGPSWQLTMQGGAVGKNPVSLPLPRAAPEVAADHVALTFKTANGGRQVTLTAGSGGGQLDVYVDFGLEVNVDANLDPRVDEMDTHGSLAVRCSINAGAARN